MRPSALLPLLCAAGSCALCVLCLLAGYKRGFMENYHLVTLNTSRIGYDVLNSSVASDSSNPLSSLIHNISNTVSGDIDQIAGDVARDLGLKDWYSWHLLDYCEGSYVPGPVANATVSSSKIHKNISVCSNRTAMYHFDPQSILQQELNKTGLGITLNDIDWPSKIQDGLNALHVATKAAFILYCIAIGLTFLAFLFSALAIFAAGRLAAFINGMVALLAFLAIGIASAIVTAIIVKGSHAINKYGNVIGVEAHRGNKFLAITWAATGLIFITIFQWLIECCIGHRRRRNVGYAEKPRGSL